MVDVLKHPSVMLACFCRLVPRKSGFLRNFLAAGELLGCATSKKSDDPSFNRETPLE